MHCVNDIIKHRVEPSDRETIEQDLPLELVLILNDDGFVFGQEYKLVQRGDLEAYHIQAITGVTSDGIYRRVRVLVGNSGDIEEW